MIEVDVALSLGTFTLDAKFCGGEGVLALFGQSGCGKSVTLSLIAGRMRPDRGIIRLDGEPLVDVANGIFLPPHKRRVGMVFQDANLFPHLSVRRNLLYGRWFAPPDSKEVEFDAVVETLGVGPLLRRRPGGLSGGERQRVAIGRALLSNPRLLLFDEPLAALDMARKLEIMPLIERVRDEFCVPVVYVSHAVEEVVRLASRVVVLHNGRVKLIGDPNEALADAASTQDRFERSSALTVVAGEEDRAYGMTALKHAAGKIWAPISIGPPGRQLRIVIRATDVILAVSPLEGVSPRNTLPGAVESIEGDGALAVATIGLAGGEKLTSVVTRKAVDELRLGPNSPVFAMIKASALDERMLGSTPKGG